MKNVLIAILKRGTFEGDKLDAADTRYLRRWATNCADDPIWEEIAADVRNYGRWPHHSIYSMVISYALLARRLAESVKAGDDPLLREKQKQRAELLALAGKADDLARYFQEVEKYSGIAMFFQRFLVLPVQPEQEAVPRIEPPFLRVQQLRQVHEQEAKLLRQRASREPKPTTFISRKRGKRHITSFIHLMTNYMDEMCGKQHRHAVAILASMAFNSFVDDEDVRKTLLPSTREARRRKVRAFNTKQS
jgi:hypothetical protein